MHFRLCSLHALLGLSLIVAPSGAQVFEEMLTIPFEEWAVAAAVGDVNGDDRDDVVVATDDCVFDRPCNLVVVYQEENGELSAPAHYASPEISSVAIADLDGDGLNDVATATDSGMGIYLQDPTTHLLGAIVERPTPRPCYKVRAADVTGDLRADVLCLPWGSSTDALYVFVQGVDGSFSRTDTTIAGSDGYDDLKIGYLDDDGLLDVVVASPQGFPSTGVGIRYGHESTIFGPSITSGSPWNETFEAVAIGQFDGNGLPDLAVTGLGFSDLPPFLAILRQTAKGTFEAGRLFESTPWPASLHAGDVNHDGLTDLVLVTGDLEVWVQTCGGDFRREAFDLPFSNFFNTHQLAMGDLNGDGLLDLALAADNIGLLVIPGRTVGLFSDGFESGDTTCWGS